VKMAAALILGVLVSVAGVLVGAWWAPFVAGLAIGIVEPRARVAVPAGAFVGLLGWALPLAAAQFRYGVGPAATSLAALMGFSHQAAIPVIFTCVVGLLVGLTGAWLGSAGRSSLSPSGRGLG
jgi:hypothetical protein